MRDNYHRRLGKFEQSEYAQSADGSESRLDMPSNERYVPGSSDKYYRSILLGFGELEKVRRQAEEGPHRCLFRLIMGHATFMYVCDECGNGTGEIMGRERAVR